MLEDKPWFDWYTWSLDHWGTKWNACEGYSSYEKNCLILIFDTAWSLAMPIIEQFTLLGYSFDVLYADEDLGVNCGKLSYNSKTKEWTCLEAEDMKNPRRFAKRIWDEY